MKKLVLFFAVALLVVASSAARADTFGSNAIDSNGVAAVAIQPPSIAVVTVPVESVYLDSNHVWAANDFRGSMFYANEQKAPGKYICMDSINAFCARTY